MKNITKYLNHYAESCINALDNFPEDISFSHSVVIPAYKETFHFVERFFNSPLAQQNSLMVLVINQPDSDTNKIPQQTLFNEVCAMGIVVWQCSPYCLIQHKNCNSAVLVLDSFSHALPVKQGVGVARKQGVDSVLALLVKNNLASNWICSTDADASLPSSYFSALSTLNGNMHAKTVAACFNFYHHCDDVEINQANALYEQALRYYVGGLTYAGSSYNFFTIGSIITFNANAYASVRGFPKRSAGEDFYLLNKLAKLGNIVQLKELPIKLTARCSDRVPFGTGPAVSHIIELQQQQQEYCYYHPQVFIVLKEVLLAFTSLFESYHDIEAWLAELSSEAQTSLLSLGFNDFIVKQFAQLANNQQKTNQQQSTINKIQFNKQLTVWFDAFKTLKFIHYMKANYWPNIPLSDAIAQAPFSLSE